MTESSPGPGRFRRQVYVNSGATALANAWTIILALVVTPILISGLGVGVFGIWALIQTFSAVNGWVALGDLGVNTAATRRIAECASRGEMDQAASAARGVIIITSVQGAIAAVVFSLAAPVLFIEVFHASDVLDSGLQIAALAFGVQMLLDSLFRGAASCLDGLQRVDTARGHDAARRTLVAVSVAAASIGFGTLPAVAVASTAASLVSVTVIARALGRRIDVLSAPAPRASLSSLVREGRSVWLLQGTGALHRMMDRVIVGVALGPASVALVEVTNQVQNGVGSALGSTSFSVTTATAWVDARSDTGRVKELLVRGTKLTCLVVLPMCGIGAVLAGSLIEVWLGPDFHDAAGLIALGLLYIAMQTPVAVGSNTLVGLGNASAVVRPASIAVALNLAFSLLLVSHLGIAGVFLGSVLSATVLAPMLLVAVTRRLEMSVREFLSQGVAPAILPALAAPAAAGAALLVSPTPLIELVAGGVVGVCAGAATALITGLNTQERSELVRLLGRHPATGGG